MRTPSILLSLILLAASAFAAVGVYAQGPPGSGDDEEGEPAGTGNEGNGNETAGSPPPGRGRGASEEARSRAWDQRNDSGTQPGPAWGRAISDAQRDPESEEHRTAVRDLPAPARERVGLLVADGNSFQGRYISFVADPEWGALHDIRAGGTPVFESIYFPAEENITMRNRGSVLELAGDTWRFHISDSPPAPMHLRSSLHPMQIVFAPGVSAETHAPMIRLTIDKGDGSTLAARFVGDAALDDATPGLATVLGDATFQVAAQQVVLPLVGNQERPALEAAMERRALGGEVMLLAANGAGTVSEVVPYEDVEIGVASGVPVGELPENATVHTVTLSAQGVPGKSFILSIESGVVDTESLAVRYYSVFDGAAFQVPLVAAASLEEALDPTGSTLPRYWVMEGTDGLMIAFSVPHFSTHILELLSFDAELIVKVVLTLGVIGAIVVVGVAVVGIFRRPEDTL